VSRRIKVLVVDDSALVRKLLSGLLSSDPSLDVVGTAVDPYDAREKIKALAPDVLTLDVEMPRMDGVTFLGHLMRLRPMPVVMVSSLTVAGADVTLAALELGAVDFITKPKLDVAAGLEASAAELIARVKAAASARLRPREARLPVSKPKAVAPVLARFEATDRLIALGASTGGTEAIADVLMALPPDAPAVVIAQHIPEVFSARWSERLDGCCAVRVREAVDGEPALLGHVYVAPGNHHLRVVRSGARYVCRVTQDAAVNRHRPSVDVLFNSVARSAGRNAVAALLTGMGADGAEGLLELKRAGAFTIAQDEATSVVWGMPGEAVKRGAATQVLPLERVAKALLDAAGAPVPLSRAG
jgi:two-component system chemotaxis response regulator CheB